MRFLLYISVSNKPFACAVFGMHRVKVLLCDSDFSLSAAHFLRRICLRYILGFSNEILIEKNNIRLCDTWEYAKKATMDVEMQKQFNL